MKLTREMEEQKNFFDSRNSSTWKESIDKESIILDYDKEIDQSSINIAKEIIQKVDVPQVNTPQSTQKVNISGLSVS